MKSDKDRPSTWVPYRNGLCENCSAGCCTMPVEIRGADLVRLGLVGEEELHSSPRKVAKKLIKEKIVTSYREGTDLFMLSSRPNGDCYFLHPQTRLCTVYASRPEVCREFPKIGPRPGYCPASRKSS